MSNSLSVKTLTRVNKDFAKLFFKYFFYTDKYTFGDGLAPSSQTIGSLLRTPCPAKPVRKIKFLIEVS
jgi:hypothetical protein